MESNGHARHKLGLPFPPIGLGFIRQTSHPKEKKVRRREDEEDCQQDKEID